MKRLPAILATFALLAAAHAATPRWRVATSRALPAQEAQRAEVVATGNRSTLSGTLDVARVRHPKPDTLSCGDFVRDSDGFDWFCSRHWAVKTDLGEDGAARILELLELAWPQYAATFGAEPPAGRRLALVAASSRDALKRAMIDDGMFSFTLGGVTQEGYGCSYLYAGTPYQTRYIVLHEATHLFQYCLNGDTRGAHGFLVEGIADYLSSHVFDPEARTLDVNVLDRAPIHNHLANGLEEWRSSGEPPFHALYEDPAPSRGISVLLTAFLQSTPEYAVRWREYCRRMLDGSPGRDGAKSASDALLAALYGGTEALGAPFCRWMLSLSPSYTLARREFDQEGANVFASCVPASPKAPAVLEWRGGPAMVSPSVRWREPHVDGGFARVELWPAGGGDPITRENSADAALGDSSVVRWRITAAQPGIVFDMAPPGSISEGGGAATVPMRHRARRAGCAAAANVAYEPLSFRLLGPFSIPVGEFGRCNAEPPTTDPSAVHTLDDGTFAVWREASINRNAMFAVGPVANITATFGRQANDSFAYALAEFDGGDGGERGFALGVSDGVEAFLNGEAVFDDVRGREWRDGNVRFRGRIRPGRNELLLRLTHAHGVWLLSGGLAK